MERDQEAGIFDFLLLIFLAAILGGVVYFILWSKMGWAEDADLTGNFTNSKLK